jgi:hypothetical protein
MKLGALDYEVFGLVLADKRHKVIECVELFRGTIDGASVYPREIVKLVLDRQAAVVVMFHNHPSMVSDQSSADYTQPTETDSAAPGGCRRADRRDRSNSIARARAGALFRSLGGPLGSHFSAGDFWTRCLTFHLTRECAS